jgi:hypothetical protein
MIRNRVACVFHADHRPFDLEASLDGAVHSVRIVHTPSREFPGNFKKPQDAADLAVAMRAAA